MTQTQPNAIKLLSRTLDILRKSLAKNPEGWKTLLQFTQSLQSQDDEEIRTAACALTYLWEGGWKNTNNDDGGKWNPGFNSMAELPHDIYQVHLEALRDMLKFQHWVKYEHDNENESISPQALLIASIRDDFEEMVPLHLQSLLTEIRSLSSQIVLEAVDSIVQQNDHHSWRFMKDLWKRNCELVKPHLTQICSATCNDLEGEIFECSKEFWISLCKTSAKTNNLQCVREAMVAIAQAVCFSSHAISEYSISRFFFVGIECGIWTHGSFARLIETSFKSLAYPWSGALTRSLNVLLRSCEYHEVNEWCTILSDNLPPISSVLRQAMQGITKMTEGYNRGITRFSGIPGFSVVAKCAQYFPSTVFSTASNMSWFLTWTESVYQTHFVLKYIIRKPGDGNLSSLDVESVIGEALHSVDEPDDLLGFLLNHSDRLTMKNVVDMLTVCPGQWGLRVSHKQLNPTIELLIQWASRVGLTSAVLQTVQKTARMRMRERWTNSALATLESDDEKTETKRVCRRWKPIDIDFSLPILISTSTDTQEVDPIASLEKLCCQLVNVALGFSQIVSQLGRDTLTETPAALLIEYLDLVPGYCV